MAGGETNLPPSIAGWWKSFNDPQLDSLIERAVKTNHDLRIAGARVREARAFYDIAASQLGPTLDAGGAYARQDQSKNQPVLGNLPMPPGVHFNNNVYQAGFDASWEIDVFGGTRRAVEAGSAEVAAAELGRQNVLVTLLGEVARNYVELRGYNRRFQRRIVSCARFAGADFVAQFLKSLQFVKQCATTDAKCLCGLRTVEMMQAQRLEDGVTFHVVQWLSGN